MDSIREIIGATNVYIKERFSAGTKPHPSILGLIGIYLTKMMRVFGVIDADDSIGFLVGDKSNNVRVRK